MPQELLPLFTIKVGDRARSYDFESRRDCYVEGEVLDFRMWDGCRRYMLSVDTEVWCGEVMARPVDNRRSLLYPPINGTRKHGGRYSFLVERVCRP